MFNNFLNILPASLFCILCGIWTVYEPGSPGKPGWPGSPVDKQNIIQTLIMFISVKARRVCSVSSALYECTLLSPRSWVPSFSLWSRASCRARDGAIRCARAKAQIQS